MTLVATDLTPSSTGWQKALERTVTGLHYDLVDVERSAGGLLRVTIDRLPDHDYANGPGAAVTVEDCEIVTRQLQFVLEVEAADYARLEVSSPGLDRPLNKPADWARFVGVEVEVTLREPFQNRRKWRGVLVAGAANAQLGSAWRLVLPPAGHGPRVVRPGSGTAKALAKARSRNAAAVPASLDSELTLDFSLDEVREARLVPVVDFKGRRGQVQLADADVTTTNNGVQA